MSNSTAPTRQTTRKYIVSAAERRKIWGNIVINSFGSNTDMKMQIEHGYKTAKNLVPVNHIVTNH